MLILTLPSFLMGVREIHTELMVHAVHQGGMRVVASNGQFDISMDYPVDASQSTAGPTPLTMLLASLAACSLNSVLLISKKCSSR